MVNGRIGKRPKVRGRNDKGRSGRGRSGHKPSYLLCIGFKKMFRKLLKIMNQQDPNFFFVCFIGAMVSVPLPPFFAVFRGWRTKLMRRENCTKLKNLTFDLNVLLVPTRAYEVCICICFLVVSLFM